MPWHYQLKLRPIASLIFPFLIFLIMGGVVTQVTAGGGGNVIVTSDPEGKLGTASTNGFNGGSTNGFFVPLGPFDTNRRACATCHVADNAYTFSPPYAMKLAQTNFRDPLFAPVDGSDCPPVSYLLPDARNSTMVLKYGLIREQIGIPSTGANFSLVTATNPKNCQIPPGSAAIAGKLILFRRPLPTTNLFFLSDVRWDGRETVQPITTGPNFTNVEPLVFDLGSQANHASITHEQSQAILGTQALTDIVDFERNLFTAQLSITPLDDLGDRGGPGYIANTLAPGFYIGQNDPLRNNFSSNVFTLFTAWEPNHDSHNGNGRANSQLTDLQKAIGEGEKIFNSRTFTIANVHGLNSAKGDPLYNPADPLWGKQITGTCGTCHNTPNIGNHSTPLPLDTGVASAVPVDNRGQPIPGILDIANLPVYALASAGGTMVRVTDPGRALITGQWVDVGKVKAPILRGLAARPPYFHNGSAKDLATVISYYNARFNIGLTPQESRALMLFLSAL